VGAHLSQEAWHSIFRQLIHQGYLEQDIGNYSILKLTEKSRPLLRNEIRLSLAKPRIKAPSEPKNAKGEGRKAAKPKTINFVYDSSLFERLRKLRKTLADAAGVPPYIVFNDVTLAQMAAEAPRTEQQFLKISGVGESKLKNYGAQFLAEIHNFINSGSERAE
jgi:ATP-dependent DNA helicase RecQ